MLRRWGPAISMLVSGAVLATVLAGSAPGAPIAAAVVYAALAYVLSPLMAPSRASAAAAVARSADDGRPVVYWRPGCMYCLRLRLRLGILARRAHWVDIWRDPAGAATVRGITGGDETVPTVVAGTASRVNPDPAWVRAQVAGR